MASWVALLPELVEQEHSSEAHGERLAALCAAITRDRPATLALVTGLGPYLTTEHDAKRARAITLLAEVLEAVPAVAASDGDAQHLAHFFTSRLTDWPALRGALQGCLALAARTPQLGAPAPAEEDVAEMLRLCTQQVFVRSLAQPDRALALRLLLVGMQHWGQALLGANIDLLEYVISSVDGEKDPRCLLLSFQCLRQLLELYQAQPETALCQGRLEESGEELFEVLACYFPVSFTPPPGDTVRITREDIAAELERTFAAGPLFAPHLLPLLLEKLSATLRQAKLDSLSALGTCAMAYGATGWGGHASTIWQALRPELVAPAAEGLLPADVKVAEEVADAAAACLKLCATALEPPAEGSEQASSAASSLGAEVLADPLMGDLTSCISHAGEQEGTLRRSVLRAKAASRALAALGGAGGATAAAAASSLLPKLLQLGAPMANGTEGPSSSKQCMAWTAIHQFVQAAGSAGARLDAVLVQQLAAAAADGCVCPAVPSGAGEADMGGSEQAAAAATPWQLQEQIETLPQLWNTDPASHPQEQAAALRLSTLSAMFASPQLAGALQPGQAEAVLQALVACITSPGSLDSTARSSTQAQAAAALAAAAGSCHAPAVLQHALPQLVAASSPGRGTLGALPALQRLAAANEGLQLEVLAALDQAIQEQLPAAASSASAAGHVTQVLHAACGIVLAGGGQQQQEGGAQAAASSGAAQLAQHLLDAVLLLPVDTVSGQADALSACAKLQFYAARAADVTAQQNLTSAAAAALLGSQPPGALQLAVCSAALIPLKAAALNSALGAEQQGQLAGVLVQYAIAAPQLAAAAHLAAQAAAALLNKWQPGQPELVDTCLQQLLEQQLYPVIKGVALSSPAANSARAAGAWDCLALVIQALAMRGHKQAEAAVGRVLQHLQAAATTLEQHPADPTQQDLLLQASIGAARCLGAALEVDGSLAAVVLNRHSHATTRLLWQQRLYSAACGQLVTLLRASMGRSGGTTGGAPAAEVIVIVPGMELPHPQGTPLLLLATAHLLRATPAGVLRTDLDRALLWLLDCLAALQRPGPLADRQLLAALVLALSEVLMSDAGKAQAESVLSRMLPILLGLARYRPSMACLLLLCELPYQLLHPYRQAATKVLAAAADDNKRTMRLQAAVCRQAWNNF